MQEVAKNILCFLIDMMNGLGTGLSNANLLDGSVSSVINSIATAIKPVGYALLAVFALLEFAQLSERVGNVTGFMGTGLVIEVLIKLILCKLVIDNSTEICQFIMSITDSIATHITGSTVSTGITKAQINTYIDNIYPEWYDILGQIAFFLIIGVFGCMSITCFAIVYVIFFARVAEIYVYTAISPIPLSTCLSKHFNVAPNFLKNLFAVGLQGALLILLVKIFGLLLTRELSGIISGSAGTGILSFLVSGSSSFAQCMQLLISTLFVSVLMLVCAFQTQKWAKSICHAM